MLSRFPSDMLSVLYEFRTTRYQERDMKLTILAATGGIGRQLLEQAVAAGHDVIALARDPKKLPAHVLSVQADLRTATPVSLEPAVRGADAILSGLGPSSQSQAGIASQGTRTVVDAMKTTGV